MSKEHTPFREALLQGYAIGFSDGTSEYKPNHVIDHVLKNFPAEDAALELLEACKAQNKAIDQLLAWLMLKDDKFMPAECGQPWEATIQGIAALVKAKATKKGD